jgi:hypothetical protein
MADEDWAAAAAPDMDAAMGDAPPVPPVKVDSTGDEGLDDISTR